MNFSAKVPINKTKIKRCKTMQGFNFLYLAPFFHGYSYMLPITNIYVNGNRGILNLDFIEILHVLTCMLVQLKKNIYNIIYMTNI